MNDRGILRAMLRTNFVKILTREQTWDALAEMPYRMAESGSASYQDLIKSEAWTAFEPYFRDIARIAFNRGNVRAWPNRDMSVGFVELMKNALTKKEKPADIGILAANYDDLSRIEHGFFSRAPEKRNPRDAFEKASREVFKDRSQADFREAMRQVMDLANQCYHYNFGLALTDATADDRQSDHNITVDTTVGPAFNELLELNGVLDGDLGSIPILSVPHQFPDDMGYRFDMFFDFSSKVGKAKIMYLSALRDVLSASSDTVDTKIDEVRRLTNYYKNTITDFFKTEFGVSTTTIERMFQQPIQLGFGQGNGEQRDSAGHVRVAGGPLGQVAIRILDNAKNYSRDVLFSRFRLSDATGKYDFKESAKVQLSDIRPQIASLAFDKTAAAKHVAKMPRYRT